MLRFLRPLLLSFAVFFVGISVSKATVVSYPLPRRYPTSSQLSVSADTATVPVIANTAVYDYCHFSFSGAVVIIVTASANITSCGISPKALNIPAVVRGKTLTFTLQKSSYLVVKINSLRELIIAADELERSVPPSVGAHIHNIVRVPYFADSTGVKPATAPIQAAIDDANKAGGGTVYVPAGVYLCGNLVLKSNVSLYLAGGSVIRGTGNPTDYTTHYHKSSLKMDGTRFISTAENAEHIKVYGRGTIDGNGSFMRRTHHYLNNLLVPLQCRDFTVDGIIFRDSGLWGLIPTRSNYVTIRNTKHFNDNDLNYEDDAIDIQECQDVLVSHTIAVSEDDTYSTKTWNAATDIAAHWPGKP